MIDLTCKHCDRHLGQAEAIVAEIICPNSKCKGSTQFKILPMDESTLITYKFLTPERAPKSKATSSTTE